MKKEKRCIFCGDEFPRTKEHIISTGVIELTIDPGIQGIFGPYHVNGYFEFKEIPIKSYVFPACETCNNYYSNIDGNAKNIIHEIIQSKPLNYFDLNNLLTWFDKVRIGLRIALFQMKDQKERILNHFYVNFNIQAKDRLLLIYKNKKFENDFVVICANTPAFQYTPSCFAIKINNYGFINVSEHYLISEKMGLPYAKDISYFNELIEVKYFRNWHRFLPLDAKDNIRTLMKSFNKQIYSVEKEKHGWFKVNSNVNKVNAIAVASFLSYEENDNNKEVYYTRILNVVKEEFANNIISRFNFQKVYDDTEIIMFNKKIYVTLRAGLWE